MLIYWDQNKAVIYTVFSILLLAIIFVFLPREPDHLLAESIRTDDKIILATEAPDYIQLYDPSTTKYRMFPSDERLNAIALDKTGEKVFVVNKEGWINLFEISNIIAKKTVRAKLADVLQSVALSGDEKYVAVGIGSSADYNARDINLYSVEHLETLDPDDVYPIATIPSRGDIQDILANPNPSINRGYIVSSQDDKLAIFEFPSGQRLGFIELGNSPAYFKIRPDGLKGYGSINARSSLVVVDFTRGKEKTLGHIKLPSAPYYLAYNADGSHLYVGSRDLNEVYVVDTIKDELVETLKLGNPNIMAKVTTELISVSTDEKYLYVIPRVSALLIYEITHDGSILKPLQAKIFPKEPMFMDVIRPK